MTEFVLGFFTPWVVFALVLGLQFVVPARELKGYARDEHTREPLTYRLNGFQVFIVVVAIWLVGGITGLVPFDWFWQHRWEGVAGALVLALPASLAVLPGVPAQSDSRVKDFFLGRRRNPRLFAGRVDAKMYLYVMGATLLELNLLSFAAHHVLSHPGNVSPGVILYVGLFTWFVCDYLVFERVHLYTYDLFAERLGFKLIGGMYGVLSVLLHHWPVGGGGPLQPGFLCRVPGVLGRRVLYGVGFLAGGEHAEVLLQAESLAGVPRVVQAPKHFGWRAGTALQRVLGDIAACKLHGRGDHGSRAYPVIGLALAGDSMALPGVLRVAAGCA